MSLSPVLDLYKTYTEWVSSNPHITSEIESSVKWLSYFAAGQFSNSCVLSELVYSVSNLLVLFNDRIIIRSQPLHSPSSAEKIKTWITILEYSEVFIEVSARQTWGEKGRWIVIVLIQIFKCVTRLYLLFHHKENIIQNPPVAPLQRKKFMSQTLISETPQPGFPLKSGRVVRSVDNGSTLYMRTWQPPTLHTDDDKTPDAPLNTTQLAGEAVYIAKPLVHLLASCYFGQKKWKPWIVSLAMDLASLQMLKPRRSNLQKTLSRRQRMELTRRQISLLLYLLRSPFYEQHSRENLLKSLVVFSDHLPLVGLILRPLAEYIPRWQDTYFYMWST